VRLNPFNKTARTIAVLGCGPAGLFAAHGLISRGYQVRIFSKKRRSEMFGAQYLHRAIPGLTDASAGRTIHYRLDGTTEGYRAKVYGRRSGISVSPEELDGVHSAWDIRAAYYTAWDLYKDLIDNVSDLGPYQVDEMLLRNPAYHKVISTIPAPALCLDAEHAFDSQTVWAVGDAPERGIFCPVTEAKPFEVICNGWRDVGWYRNANVFGYRTAEWAMDRKPPIEGIAQVEKPLSTNCDCLPDVIRVGRFGEWRKGVLSHEAYEKALKL
jgi:hypothetical protein